MVIAFILIQKQLIAKNTSAASCRWGILFPAVSGIEYTTRKDGWYLFPKYQNINSNETTFIYEESVGLDFTVKAYRLKKKYADCFSSDTPETMVETEQCKQSF